MARKKTDDITVEDFEKTQNEEIEAGLDDEDISSEDFDGLYGEDTRVMDKHQELLRGLTDFDPYLQQKFTQWCGHYWDEESKKFVKDPQIKPILNEQGAKFFVSFLQTYVRGNNVITVLPAEIFRYCMLDILNTVFESIAQYYKEFEIKSVADQGRLMDEIENSAQLILSGSVGGEYNKFIGGTYRAGYQDSMSGLQGNTQGYATPPPPPNKRGLFNKLKNVFN